MPTLLKINGEMIPPELLQEEFQVIKANYERMAAMSCCERDPEFRGYARENVVARVLLNQEAERRYPALSDAELGEAVERLAAENGGMDSFCQRLGVSGPDDPVLLADVASGLRMDRLILEATGLSEEVPDEILAAFHQKNLADYLTPERLRASHIFKTVEKAEDREGVYDGLRKIRREARSGADFDALGLAHTDKEDKLVDLGWFGRGEFSDEFDLILFSLEIGEVSPVFASHWGFHLAKVTGRENPEPRPFEEVREEVRQRHLAELRQEKTREYVEELKKSALIEEISEE